MRWTAAAFLALSCATVVAQSPARDRTVSRPQTGTAAVSGRVVAASTGDPLRHAVVRISGGKTSVPPTLTDDAGHFQFANLPAAAFRITASKPGFAKASARVDVVDRAAVAMPEIALPRGGVITGVLIDDTGEPAIGGGVMVSRIAVKADGSIQQILVATGTADDNGAFRIGSLPADTYVVNAARLPDGAIFSAQPGEDLTRASIRFRLVEGARFALRAGEEHSGVVVVAPSDRLVPPAPGARGGPPPPSGLTVPAPPDPRLAVTVRGRVTRPGGPGSRALLQLLPVVPGPPVVTQADENGRYELVMPSAAEGDYRVSARKAGYDFAEYGAQGNRRGVLLHLKPGDVSDDVDIALRKFSTVSGRILDDSGEPVEGALVRAAQLRWADGQRKLVDAFGGMARTDDLGRYRLIGLRPGQYALIAAVGQVVVTEAAADFPGFSTTYFPGTTAPSDIQLISVAAAQELADLDFRLVPQRTFRIAGHAADSVGDPVSGGISLTPRRRSGSIATIQLGAKIDRDGGFEFSNVPPGEYVLQVTRGTNRNAFTEGEFAYRFIDIVDADVTDLDMQTGLGSTISGHLTFEGGEPPSLERFDLSAMPVDLDRTPSGQSARARFDGDNHFELARINGPRRLQLTRVAPGWTMRSVIVNGMDVTDEPLLFGRDDESLEDVEVVVSNRVTRLAGTVTGLRDATPSDLAVLAFSTRAEQWYLNTRFIKRTVPRPDGTFSFEGLPPGEYSVMTAYPPDDPGEWRDPGVLEKLALQATRVRLSEGQQVSVELRFR